ncbi:hypothetical protein BH10CYA1_BH10CYA1_53480 [soil metagenome]
MKFNFDSAQFYELLPDFLADCYFGLSAPELFLWIGVVLVSFVSHKTI